MANSEIESCRQTRANCKSRLTKFKTFLDKCSNKENDDTVSVEEIQLRLNKIEENWKEYDRAQLGLEMLAPNQNRELERSEFEDCHLRYTAIALKLIKERSRSGSTGVESRSGEHSEHLFRIAQLEAELSAQRTNELANLRDLVSRSTTSSEETVVRRHFPLPTLSLPTFSGGYGEWLGFRDAFSAIIHDDVTIPKIQKLRYLRAYLGGEAAQIIENIETSSNNYEEAWNLLHERYNNERIIIQNHMQAVFDLPNINRESNINLRGFYDAILKHMRALKVLNEPTDKWDTPLICLLTSKLDKESRREWEKCISGNQMPKFDKFTNFLRDRCQLLEAIYSGCGENNKQYTKPSGKWPTNNEKKTVAKSFVNTQGTLSCYNCKNNHLLNNCQEFIKLSVNDRKEFVKKKGLCYNCLRKNHLISECRSGNCIKCNKRHHTLLHIDNVDMNSDKVVQSNNNISQGKILHICDASTVLLSTALVYMFDIDGNKHECRILLDSGSQPNVMTVKFAKLLRLKKRKTNASIEVINSHEIDSLEWVHAKFESRFNNYSTKLSFLVLPRITSVHPSNPVNKEILNIPKNIFLADSDFDKPSEIDALVGAEIFYDLLCNNRIPLALPHTQLQSTKIGWIVTGRINNLHPRNQLSCNLIRDQVHDQLEKFWRIEELPVKKYLSPEEEACEHHFRQTVQRDSSGKYMIRLPLKKEVELLGSSYEVARRRFFSLERRLEKDTKLKTLYHQFMQEYLDLDHMEEIGSNQRDGFFIPHHAILKESSLTTKLRAVFNGSAKTNSGLSLNDVLMLGPVIQDGVLELILRFRLFEVAVGADIEKMYRQFLIHPEDRKYQRIIWRFNTNEPLKIYQLKTITYGTSAAPFLATRCLSQLAEDEESEFPEAAAVLRSDFYVDDMLSGADSFEKAERLVKDLIQITSKAGLRLCKWVSNDPRITSSLSDSLRNMRKKLKDEKITTKTLGIVWDASSDELGFEVNLNQESELITKRSILSETAQLYDPQGWIAPVIVLAKIEMQQLWKLKLGWDDPVPKEVEANWLAFREQLNLINDWRLPRLARIPQSHDLQLHGFSDASQRAYGACIYLRSVINGEIYSILLCSKSRVAPLQIISLPRLELCGAVLLAKLFMTVSKALKVDFQKVTFWTDSTIVLNWINKPPYKLETFEANRIAEIQSITSACNWRHVSSADNPADVLSRGQLAGEFINNQLWKHGPTWLRKEEINWPSEFRIGEESHQHQEKVQVLTATINERWNLWNKYSSFQKLIRVFAYCLRFCQNTREKKGLRGELSVEELRSAEVRMISIIQKEEFSSEIQDLRSGRQITKSSKIIRLSPFIDDQVLRVGGRIQQSDLQIDQIHPILLPKNHPVTTMLIRNTHFNMKHAGINATLYSIRKKYWIVDGRLAVRKIVMSCVKCCRAKPREVAYVMGNLPKVRLSATRPFENVGVDYCGHFFIKEKRHRNRSKLKVYAAIFICLATKAVHIELVEDLTSEAFIGSLRRFFARRGKARALYTDNGTNFVGANNELKCFYEFLASQEVNEKIKRELSNQLIEWHFNPPRTPHFGGIWEAAVRALKHHLRRVIGDVLLSYEEMITLMCEIEALLNSRPLTPMSSDPNDFEVLTPGHFLIGQSLLTIPSTDLSMIPSNRLNIWQHIQKIKNDLWKRWSKEYLNELNLKSKWFVGEDNIKVGALVTIKEENVPPLRWCLGRVVEVIRGDDSVVRVVKLKTNNGVIERGVKRISPLPVEINL